MENDSAATLQNLPCRFTPCETTTDDMDRTVHRNATLYNMPFWTHLSLKEGGRYNIKVSAKGLPFFIYSIL
jgi:hypothetical protein